LPIKNYSIGKNTLNSFPSNYTFGKAFSYLTIDEKMERLTVPSSTLRR